MVMAESAVSVNVAVLFYQLSAQRPLGVVLARQAEYRQKSPNLKPSTKYILSRCIVATQTIAMLEKRQQPTLKASNSPVVSRLHPQFGIEGSDHVFCARQYARQEGRGVTGKESGNAHRYFTTNLGIIQNAPHYVTAAKTSRVDGSPKSAAPVSLALWGIIVWEKAKAC
ncbi:hypothetical protein BDY19DRAFT_902869 [Irpex rosettiformis]|uniref:Uncharacterized protein n=1 Tax=Irpex rosettiformis TaxID=378272 RepID=A0ACB8UFE5_9APHY|nr:hypothetical protein BDY19DRAFT_902869 [Irpex rosettiformis]